MKSPPKSRNDSSQSLRRCAVPLGSIKSKIGNPKSKMFSRSINSHNFQPFGGFSDGAVASDGAVHPPQAPGIGFDTRVSLYSVFRSLL